MKVTDDEILKDACQERNLGPGSYGTSDEPSYAELILAHLKYTEKQLAELEID